MACVLCSLGLAVCVPSASAEGSAVLGGTGGSPLESPLVLPESQALLGGQGVREAEEVRRDSPEAVAARIASATAFEGLDGEQVAKVAKEAFPGLVDHPAGGPPPLPEGQTIDEIVGPDAVEVAGGGRHEVIESTAPIAVQGSSGQWEPVNLGLVEAEGGFQPATPVVGVQIPKRLGDGVRLAGVGVSLTPTEGSSGSPLEGSGEIVGSTVLYANTQTDMASMIKPTTAGFAADTLLLSEASPQQIYFRVGMPEGASLVQAKDGSGVVEVLEEGAAIATISAPRAVDAAGTAVSVSMSLSGDTLVLSVADHSAEYQYPVEVDPEVTGKDVQLTKEGSKRSNWEFYTGKGNGKNEPSTNFASSEEGGILKTYGVHEYKEGEEAFWVYQTRGVSKIYQFKGETEASNKEDHIESVVELQYGEVKTEHGVTEAEGKAKKRLSTETEGTSEYKQKEFPVLCPSGTESCPESAGHEGNAVHFQQSVVNKPTSKYSFSDELDKGTVYISEPEKTHSTTSYNTSSEKFEYKIKNSKGEEVTEKRNNALYGTSNWLSEYKGAIQFIAKDTGIGVAKSILEYENSGKWEAVSGSEHNYLTGDLCKGVQCEAKQEEYWTLNPHLPNGEDKIRYRAEEAFGQETHQTESLESEGVGTVKVDTSKPHGLFVSGLPYGNELAEKSYELTTYATDGEGSTVASSGIMGIEGKEKGIALYVDGVEAKEVGTQTGCSTPKGECTASAKWKIEGAELGAGHHAIVIVAKDRAGNEGREEETISIRHSTPVPLGPGDVDLESGDFTLGSGDVSLGGGLSVSRVYSSRDVTAGVEGGSLLGPQWSLSVGSQETLVEMPDYSVLVTSATGGETIFAAILNSERKPTGKFEAPPGDSNLTMTLEENEKTKEKLAYYLKDPAAGTSTKFELPAGSIAKVWVPFEQTGPVSTDTVSYVYETAEVGGKKVTRPSEERGATPAKVSCAPKMEPGCRALKFTYATKTKSEIGEGPTEWGEYEGRLVKVSYEGYNPATKKMTEAPVPVAEYSYDKQGRLRAEWDPRLSPHELKTSYGYDEEGHVTALTPPGEESWAFTYGTTAGDAGTGRLIKATQAPVSAGVWNGKAVENTEAPKITGSPRVNIPGVSVSNGAWSNSPVVYGYQWEDCNSSGGECVPIPGATNESYTPMPSDVAHKLVAKVTATNGGGSSVAVSAASAEVKLAEEYALPSNARPTGITTGPEGDMWFVEPGRNKIEKMTTSESITEYPLPTGSEPRGITVGPEGNLWFTESGTSKIGRITPAGEVTEYAPAALENLHPQDIILGPDGNLWFTFRKKEGGGPGGVGKITTSGTTTTYFITTGSENCDPATITAGSNGELWFDFKGGTLNEIVDSITTSGTKLEEHKVERVGDEVGNLTAGPDGNLWFTVWNQSVIGKLTTSGEVSNFPVPGKQLPEQITSDPDGKLWFTYGGELNSRIGSITTAGTASEYSVLSPSDGYPEAITAGPDGNLWITQFQSHFPKQPERGEQEEASGVGKIVIAPKSAEYALDSAGSPESITAGPEGDMWFTDWRTTKTKYGIGKITTSGTVTEYGNEKTSEPSGITAGPDGNMWFTDHYSESSLIGKITTSGSITEYSLPGESNPKGIATGSDGNLWFTEEGDNKIGKITTSGTITQYGPLPSKSHPRGITAGPDGNLWFTDAGTSDIGKITTSGTITEYPLPAGSEPRGIVAGPAKESVLWFTDYGTGKIGKITTSGTVTEYALPLPENSHPEGITAGADGNLWFTVSGTSKIGKITTSGTITEYPQLTGSSPRGITTGPDGYLWFANHGTTEIAKTLPMDEPLPQPGTTIDYNVPVSGTGAPHNMSATEVAKWGQKAEEVPEEATAIFPPDSPQGWPASSYTRASIYYLDEHGRLVNTATPSTGTYGSISTTEYNETNDVVRTLSPDNRAAALKEGCESESNCASAKTAKLLSSENTYNGEGEKETEVLEPGTQLILSRGPEHMVKYVKGEEHYKAGEQAEEAMARSLTKYFYNEGAPTENPRTKKKEAYDLATTTQNFAELINKEGRGGETVDESETKTGYSGQEDLGWELRAPTSVTAAPGSLNLTSTTEYYESGEAMGKVKETRTPKGSGGKSAHDSKIVYYGLEENKEYPECGKHPEWAGLVCETLPAKQPETTGVPNLPVTKSTYNIWNEPEAIIETFPKSGSFAEHTRTTKDEYDSAGRMKTSEETSTATTETADRALPQVTEEYSTATGALEKQSTTVSGKTKTITNKYNTLGQLESYTDADGNVAKFKHAGPENDGLLEEVSDSSDEGTSNQKYTYSATTKQLEKLVDSAGGTFTASYDTEGKLSSEVYPNGMCANYTYNSVGEATHIEYTKTTTCSEKEGVWFSETKTPSIRGEVMSKTSTLASEEYGYDTLGRLTEVHETPAGEYCKTRLYEYEAESNRTKQTTREPSSKKECATEGGTVQEHTYDEANRLTDSGITYDPLGNVTKLPSGDAESHTLESTFYVDNAVATQTQNGVTNDYYMDPDGRVRETITGAKKLISHYDGSGEAVAWTCEGTEKAEACESGGKWTRYIPGIDGTLTAVENGKGATYETPILQLHDLQGDIIATIKDKTGETKLESTYNPTEFGVPNGGKEPPKFAWLGAEGVEKSLASGVVTEGATSYVPQTGMALQSEEVAPPGLPDGSGGQAASFTASPWNLQGAERVGAEAPGQEAQREKEAWETACLQSPTPGCPNYVAPPGGAPEAPASPEPPPPAPGSPPSMNPGGLQGGCQSGAACAASVKVFGPNSCHFPYSACHIDFTRAITKDIVKDIFPHENEESLSLATVCAIPALVSAEAAGALGFGCLAVMAYYWGSLVDVVNHIHEWGGCISIRYQVVPAPWVTGVAADGGSGCV
jgi:streptogramin lyase